jgi:hypothetical protein
VVVTVRDLATDVAPDSGYGCDWSADGRVVYFVGRDPRERSVGVCRVPAAGGTARLVVQFDDPSRPWHPYGFRVHGRRFYFKVGDEQSDMWMTEVEGSR